MMKAIVSLVAVFSLTAFLANAAEPLPSADHLISAAEKQAAAGNKAIFVHFGASWCGWCKRLDAFLEKPAIKPVFEKYFVPVKLVVQEKDKATENPGAEEWLKKMGGPSGLPYSAFLNAKGEVIVNSKRDGNNIGYPAEPAEIDWFIHMMKQAAPNMAPDDLKTIETALRSFKH